jgi:hypothetical protein
MSGEEVRVVLVEVDAEQSAMLRARGWSFDWNERTTDLIGDHSLLKAVLIGQEIQGLVEYEILQRDLYVFVHKLEIDPHNRGQEKRYPGVAGMLLAYVARESFSSGCDGFVVLVAKTVLYEYYQVRYGAKPLGGTKLYFDTEASARLIEEYLVGKEIRYE